MVNNVYCSTCELRSLFYLTIYCCSSDLRLRHCRWWITRDSVSVHECRKSK